MDLFLGFLFCSIDLYICLCANTILSWWLWLCSIVWSQAGLFLQFHSSFSRLLWLFEVFCISIQIVGTDSLITGCCSWLALQLDYGPFYILNLVLCRPWLLSSLWPDNLPHLGLTFCFTGLDCVPPHALTLCLTTAWLCLTVRTVVLHGPWHRTSPSLNMVLTMSWFWCSLRSQSHLH